MSAMIAIARTNAVYERCSRIICRTLNLGAVRKLDGDTRFLEDLQADSLDMMSIAMSVEEEFGIAVPDDDAAGIETLGGMVAMVGRLMEQQG